MVPVSRWICRRAAIWTLLLSASLSVDAFAALGDPQYVLFSGQNGALALVQDESAAPLRLDANDYPGVLRAARDLQSDIERVTGVAPDLLITPRSAASAKNAAGMAIIIGTLGQSALIEDIVERGKLDVREIRGKWESFVMEVVETPLPGVERALVIAGSDKRGTIYGIYDLSEHIGVSPWYWWADVPVDRHDALFVMPGRRVQGEPVVKYRGIFLNDEAPALSGWAEEKFGGFNHQFYGHVFELILRLRGNYLWPAMWGSAFIDDDPLNAPLADEYGIVMGTSHHEPLTRAHDEWRRYGEGPWDYARNASALREFWRSGLKRVRGYEKIVTIGMRGDGDEAMSEETNVALLERIVADQRQILSDVVGRKPAEVPQLWALYKEVQGYYERGMRVPDDVTLLWCDDNWGNIRRLPIPDERERSGGAGIYYHLDYVGGPRNYKWPVGRNRLHALQGSVVANADAARARELFEFDGALAEQYHSLGGGKWNHMMSQINMGYTYWQQPDIETMPAVSEVRPRAGASMAVALEGSRTAWPSYNAPAAVLPPLDVARQGTRWIDVFNRGRESYDYTISADQPWLTITPARGTVEDAVRVEVGADWAAVPVGTTTARISVEASTGENVDLELPVNKPAEAPPSDFESFIETDRHIAIEAPNFSRSVSGSEAEWKTLPGFGRTRGGVTPVPVTAATQTIGPDTPRLEYDLYLHSSGELDVELYCAPSLDFQPGENLAVAVSFDDDPPQTIDLDTQATRETWARAVADGIRRIGSTHRIGNPGRHVLKLWMVTPGVVVERIVVDAGGVRPSYLGPPESPRR